MLILRTPTPNDKPEILAAYQNSSALHAPWTSPPKDIDQYLAQEQRYFLCQGAAGPIVGTFHISGIIRGYFQSGYLGYEAFAPHHGQGHMRAGLALLLAEAFGPLNLHRLEANIQPGNLASIRLVAGGGFGKEGYSRHYLRIGGREWMDHERWAIINQDWREDKPA